MKRIEINTDVIDVPESWDDITLSFYETWFYKAPKDRKEQIELVAEICKIDTAKLLDYPVDVCNIILDTITFVFTETATPPSPSIEIGGVKYTIPIAETLTTGAWIDAEEVQKEKVNTLSGILAITCLPVGETYDTLKTEERRKMFAELKVSEVLPLLSFFLHYKKGLEKRLAMFSRVAEAANLYVNSTANFPNVGGGTRLSLTWRKAHFYVWMKYLKSQLRKCLRSLGTKPTENKPKGRKGILKNK